MSADAPTQLLGHFRALRVGDILRQEHLPPASPRVLLHDDAHLGIQPDDLVPGLEVVLLAGLLRDRRLSLLR